MDWREVLLPRERCPRRAWYYTHVQADDDSVSLAVLPASHPLYWGSALGVILVIVLVAGTAAMVFRAMGEAAAAQWAVGFGIGTPLFFGSLVCFDARKRRGRPPLLVCDRQGRLIGGVVFDEWMTDPGALRIMRIVVIYTHLRIGLHSRPLTQLQAIVERADGTTERRCIYTGITQIDRLARRLASALNCKAEIVKLTGSDAPTELEWAAFNGH